MQQLLAGETWNRYRVDAYIGGGGMADVYLVTHVELGVQRALKVLRRGGGEVTERLVREGRVQASLMHPNLVPVLELIRVHGHPALVMDYVEGPALDGVIKAGPLSLEQVDHIARGLLDGMIAAHRRGIIHRDLKPANIMLDVRDDPPVARVMDFGLAKAVMGSEGASSTASGMLMGTPRYMAPEQMYDAKKVDERADVWSIGAILYELVTGEIAFPGDSLIATMRAVDQDDVTPVSELRPDAPARMVLAIEEALVKDVDGRCASVKALRELWVGSVHHVQPTAFDLAAMIRPPTPLPASQGGARGSSSAGALPTLDPSDPAAAPTLEPGWDASISGQVSPATGTRMAIAGTVAAVVGVVAVGISLVVVALAVFGVFSGPARGPGTADGTAVEIGDPLDAEPAASQTAASPAPGEQQAASSEEVAAPPDGPVTPAPGAPDEPSPARVTAAPPPARKVARASPPPSTTVAKASTAPASTAPASTAPASTAPAPSTLMAGAAPVPTHAWTATQKGNKAVMVRLQDAAGHLFAPGRLPQGSYRIAVRPDGDKDYTTVKALELVGDIEVICNGVLYDCDVVP